MAIIDLGVVGCVNRGNYIGGTEPYDLLQIVKYDGAIYQCIQAHDTEQLPPSNEAYWQLWVDPSGTGFDFVHSYNPAINTNAALDTTWFNTTTFEIFVCRDATLNANEWEGSEGTIISPAYIAAPTVTVTGEPASVTLTPTITGTAYSIVGSSELHTDTDIEVYQGATLVYSVNITTSLTSYTMPSGYLVAGTSYTFKMRYNSATLTGTFGSKTATTSATPVTTAGKAIFAYGDNGNSVSMSNLVSNTGVVSNDVTGVGTARYYLAAAGYGTDKAIFAYGYNGNSVSMSNLVSNTGVVSNDVTGVGTARYGLAAAGYGTDKAIFAYGYNGNSVSMSNLVSNTGVVSNDVTGVGTARYYLAAAGYGTDKAIFAYGDSGGNVSMSNLVSNTGVVSNDVTGVGTARYYLAAAGYGTDKAIFAYGDSGGNVSMSNLVSNTGVVSNDVTGVGTARYGLAAAGYGTDKAIFAYGDSGGNVSMSNLVSNTGVVSNDVTGVGTARYLLAAAGYGA